MSLLLSVLGFLVGCSLLTMSARISARLTELRFLRWLKMSDGERQVRLFVWWLLGVVGGFFTACLLLTLGHMTACIVVSCLMPVLSLVIYLCLRVIEMALKLWEFIILSSAECVDDFFQRLDGR